MSAVNGANGNGIWKAIATGACGLCVGLLIAWFTALSKSGVSQRDMEDYVKNGDRETEARIKENLPSLMVNYMTHAQIEEYVQKYSPYAVDRPLIQERRDQDNRTIGQLQSKMELLGRLLEEQPQPHSRK